MKIIIEYRRKGTKGCEGYPQEGKRVPVSTLTGDLAFHPEHNEGN